jgi:hypothetical protein
MLRRANTPPYTLRRASSVVFALLSVLPLLLFAYTLYTLGVLNHHVAQIGLGSALVLSMIGFYIYSVMMSRLSDILRDLETEESAPQLPEAAHGPVVTMAVEPGPSGPMAEGHTAGAPRQTPAPASGRPSPSWQRRLGAGGRGGLSCPAWAHHRACRRTQALSDLTAEGRGRALSASGPVAVRNALDPVKGVMAQVTQDGVILDQNGTRVGISYTRVSAIEADTTPEPA